MQDLTNCPTCNGTGKINITVNTIEAGVSKTVAEALPCHQCGGAGKCSPGRAAAIAAMNQRIEAMWCRCAKSSGSTFHDDSAGSKHHYTCDDCGKVTQIG